MYKVSKNIMLSTSLVLLLSACGGGDVQRESSVSLDQTSDKVLSVEESSPYFDEVLTPKDMPKISRDENLPQNTIIRIDKNSFNENEKIVVNLNNMLGHQDWCGIYKVGASSDWDNVISWAWTGDIKNGEISLNGVDEGDYEIRAFFQNSFKDVARARFSVNANGNGNGGAQANATVSVASVNAKEKITVHLENVSVRDKDWVGIYKQGSSNDWSNVLSWAWTGDIKSGDVSLEGLSAGTYDVRVFYHNSFDVALKTTLKVESAQQGQTSVTLNQNSFKENESITVNLQNMQGNENDWVGIYKAGSSNDWGNVVSWKFTEGVQNGTITLDGVPAGSYDVRVFFNNSYDLEASTTISVASDGNGGNQDGISQLALFADEHNPHNRLLAFDYGNMELVEEVQVAGSNNHHADVVGTITNSKYVMMVPKNSKFVTFRDIKTREFVKKLDLPMRPRSGDAYNADKNLILLTAADRPAAVLIDADSLNIVGKAGFNISCDLKFNKENYFPWYYKRIVYKWNDIPENKISCVAPDFGGQNISGHPVWLSTNAFAILDRANRLIHVYKISYIGNGQYKTKLTDTIRTSTSLHQLVPEDKNNPYGSTFFGMTEGNGGGEKGEAIAPVMYKFKYSNGRLRQKGKTSLVTTKTIQMMKEVKVYDKYVSYNKKVQDVSKKYYKYYYPSRYGNYNVYYPGDYNSYYDRYYNSYHNYYNNNIQSYKNYYIKNVPYNVQQTLKSLGGHNLYLDPDREFLYGAVASGQTFVVNKNSMKVTSIIPSGEGAGHVNFAKNNSYGVITNHTADYVTIFDYNTQKFVKNINLGFEHENISKAFQSHSPYTEGKYFYNTWTDGGVFFRIDMDNLKLDKSQYVGGVPIQGNYFPFIKE